MSTRRQSNLHVSNLSFDMEEVPMLGFSSPAPACLFVDKLNKIYDLELEYRTTMTLQMPENKPYGLPEAVEADMYAYYESTWRLLYLMVQMPRFRAAQGELIPADPMVNLDKLLFLHGESAFEKARRMHDELSFYQPPAVIDLCDLRAERRRRLQEEFASHEGKHMQLIAHETQREQEGGGEDPMLCFVRKKKGAGSTPKPAREPRSLSRKPPIEQLGQTILNQAYDYFTRLAREERMTLNM